MPGTYEKAITIQKAIDNIVCRRYLLPAIQRKFTWDTDQICVLFDSIMRRYPINTFMFWEVKKPELKRDFRFYQFLEKYCERFAEDNPPFTTANHEDFHAVIDGQQRLTSLYIGLKGTYAYRLPRKHWKKVQDDTVSPTRRLYLNLEAPLDAESNESMMMYEFDFLTNAEFLNYTSKGKIWFLVGDILGFKNTDTPDQVVMEHLDKTGQSANAYARETLTRLYSAIRQESTINYYLETDQDIDHVLDVFLRTNHGGTPLSFSQLLMSIAIANWKNDARQQIDDLVEAVRQNTEFSISREWILKSALMLTGASVRFKVENFTEKHVAAIEAHWDEIKACILASFELIRSFGLSDVALRAKNAAIPIAHYLYRKRIYTEINRLAKHVEDRRLIAQWLYV